MATIKSIVKITSLEDESLQHYDVNYEEGFVVVITPDELDNIDDIEEVIVKADLKAVVIEEQKPATASETIVLPS